jgi:type IV secretory pathway VirB10-like protein
VIFPNGGQPEPQGWDAGTDTAGAACFHDQVKLHLLRVFGNALLPSVLSAGVS